MDEETEYYYYGACYYNPRESVWLSTGLSGLKALEYSGELTYKVGLHGAKSVEYMFQGKELVKTLNEIAKPIN